MRKNRHIPVYEPRLLGREKEYVRECLATNWISSLGRFIPAFEKGFSGFCGAKYGVATTNGTSALELALRVLGIGSGDEVIVPDLTFVASANAVTYTGARPVFADIDEETWTLSPKSVLEKISPRTRAVMPVHLYGHPVDMGAIKSIARRHKLFVVEDAAEAHGARYKGKAVGGLGDIGCFSFYGNKIISTGEGGMIVTNNLRWARRASFLRDHGMSRARKYWHNEIGYNFRMTNIQAAIGLGQLEKINQIIEKKRRIALWYRRELSGLKTMVFPPEAAWARNVYWMYCLLLKKDAGLSRDELQKRLKEKGIDTRPFFYPLHKLPPYREKNRYPVAEKISRAGINLPSSPSLKRSDVSRIARIISKILEG